MIYQVSVPAAAPDVEEIRILEWHGAPGRRFAEGELVVELETHKALVEVRAGQPGVLRQILVEAGEWQKVGAPLALFTDEADEPLETGEPADMTVEFEVS